MSAGFFDDFLERRQHAVGDGSRAPVLRVLNPNDACLPIDLAPLECEHLALPPASPVHERHHGPEVGTELLPHRLELLGLEEALPGVVRGQEREVRARG
jgi:hypothetical protein